MLLIEPDPHPGRCRNHRSVTVGGYPQNVRCLGYEGTRHVCTFDIPSAPPVASGFVGTKTPKPWVAPDTQEVGP